jgi:hypothetical protein
LFNQVLFDADQLAFQVQLQNAQSSTEKDYLQVRHDLALLLRLCDLQATEQEVRAFGPHLPQFVALCQSLLSSQGLPTLDSERIHALISSSIDYYAMAVARNAPMVDHTLALLSTTHSQIPNQQPFVVLVAGGFHTTPVTQLLRQRNVSYLVITPTVDTLSNADHDLYIKRLNGQPLSDREILDAVHRPLALAKGIRTTTPDSALAIGRFGSDLWSGFLTTIGLRLRDPQALLPELQKDYASEPAALAAANTWYDRFIQRLPQWRPHRSRAAVLRNAAKSAYEKYVAPHAEELLIASIVTLLSVAGLHALGLQDSSAFSLKSAAILVSGFTLVGSLLTVALFQPLHTLFYTLVKTFHENILHTPFRRLPPQLDHRKLALTQLAALAAVTLVASGALFASAFGLDLQTLPIAFTMGLVSFTLRNTFHALHNPIALPHNRWSLLPVEEGSDDADKSALEAQLRQQREELSRATAALEHFQGLATTQKAFVQKLHAEMESLAIKLKATREASDSRQKFIARRLSTFEPALKQQEDSGGTESAMAQSLRSSIESAKTEGNALATQIQRATEAFDEKFSEHHGAQGHLEDLEKQLQLVSTASQKASSEIELTSIMREQGHFGPRCRLNEWTSYLQKRNFRGGRSL